ncbi:similarity to endo-1-like protein [Leishmania mexicana MHOM/GT/2001/U1103]|uniref:Similarity to endo-1-like protein n=1 Tax=Leishmania mexicana (strain MHOM/GT/2001/U1103) TaxID=929439 RepID=E9AU90_LEIMU|nr:similarity to endo-1-like protein [Leishmania mexicana MHOM/GT/2001/U1103]CBZ26516.1 similarity to endo-1-like protein [Leishmania mexicana MHOM/GT/2001/U1103]
MSAEHPNRCCPTEKGPAKCAYSPAGNDLYIVGPYNSKAGVVLVCDIFGLLPNSKRFADVLAEQGFLVVMPDFFGSLAWPESEWPADFQSTRWTQYVEKITQFDSFVPRMEAAIAVLRQVGCAKVGAIGMCWGATLPFMMAAQGKIDAAAAAHPSFFTADALRAAKAPVLVLPSKDEPPMEDVEAAVNSHPMEPHVYKRFDTLQHGFFGSRYNPDTYTAAEVKDVEMARQLVLDFFKKSLH